MSRRPPRVVLFAALASTLAVLAPAGVLLVHPDDGPTAAGGVARATTSPTPAAPVAPVAPVAPAAVPSRATSPAVPATLPGGRSTVFGGGRFLVAYYGTAGTDALGVLGAASPERIQHRLARAGRAFARPGHPVQLVDELIVSVADRRPGKDGDYSHDLEKKQVRRYLAAAHRHHTLVLLDLQTGHSDFLRVAKRWRWALRDPWVGLALDPEWRMSGHDVPGQVIGHVHAGEINRTSAWLSRLVAREHLPQKLFVVHQFRAAMIDHIGRVKRRPGLALVQHVDGFGTPGEKKATFHAVARPKRFTLGFKLFYRADIHRMSARQVFGLRPTVRFVSFQ